MRNYVLSRLMQAVVVVWLVSFFSFSLVQLLPGDPLAALSGEGEGLTEEARKIKEKQLGLDKPIPEQYGRWLGDVVQGDLGRSIVTRRKVGDVILDRLPTTLQLSFVALVVAIAFALPAGIASAVWRNSLADRIITLVTVAGVAMPDFFFATILVMLLTVQLDWFPAIGFTNLWDDPIESLRHMALPVLVLSWAVSAAIARQVRSSMLEVLRQDYIRTARSKGLREARVIWVHGLRNSLLPVVTIVGALIGRLFAGAVIVETFFSITGMGSYLIQGILQRDFLVLQGVVLVVGVAVVVANLLTDLSYAWLDPRIRYG